MATFATLHVPAGALPPTDQQLRDVVRRPVTTVVHLADAVADPALAERLADAWSRSLPDHVVRAGQARVSVTPVPSRTEILAARREVLHSARVFQVLGTRLCHRLARQLSVTPQRLGCVTKDWLRPTVGPLNRMWRYRFHGHEVAFEHRSGLRLEVQLGHGADFGTLHPDFFAYYLATPLKLIDVAGLVREDAREVQALLLDAPRVHAAAHALILGQPEAAHRVFDVLELETALGAG